MHLIIGLGLAFALVLLVGTLLFVLVLPCIFFVASEIFSVNLLSWMAECPACSKGGMKLVALVPFGDRFYRCSHCGGRFKRKAFAWKWRTASCPGDDAKYRRRQAHIWVGGASAGVSETTCGELLVRKRSWNLATLVHRTGGELRVVHPTLPNTPKSIEESETTVRRLLRTKLFRGNLPEPKSPSDPWSEFRAE